MSHSILFRPLAEKELLKLPKEQQVRIGRKIDALAHNPRPAGCAKLSGSEVLWRVRVGDYRVIYQIEDARLIVVIIEIAHRREVYRRL